MGCKNSPKNAFVADFAALYWAADFTRLGELMADQVQFAVGDGRNLHGRSAVEAWMVKQAPAQEVEILHAFAHGRSGVADGVVTTKDARKLAFCLLVDFTNLKGEQVRSVTLYTA